VDRLPSKGTAMQTRSLATGVLLAVALVALPSAEPPCRVTAVAAPPGSSTASTSNRCRHAAGSRSCGPARAPSCGPSPWPWRSCPTTSTRSTGPYTASQGLGHGPRRGHRAGVHGARRDRELACVHARPRGDHRGRGVGRAVRRRPRRGTAPARDARHRRLPPGGAPSGPPGPLLAMAPAFASRPPPPSRKSTDRSRDPISPRGSHSGRATSRRCAPRPVHGPVGELQREPARAAVVVSGGCRRPGARGWRRSSRPARSTTCRPGPRGSWPILPDRSTERRLMPTRAVAGAPERPGAHARTRSRPIDACGLRHRRSLHAAEGAGIRIITPPRPPFTRRGVLHVPEPRGTSARFCVVSLVAMASTLGARPGSACLAS